MPDDLQTFLASCRARIDEALERFLPRPPACPPLLSEAMRYSVFAGGKRLRPSLALAAADACARRDGREPEAARTAALPAGCAIELIHTYSLIHDDLPAMDDDTLRRGYPTLHVVYGDGLAILAGDGLQAEAFALMAREPAGANGDRGLAARKLRVIELVAGAAGAIGMVGGQAIDLQAAGRTRGQTVRLDAEGLRAMHARKTGALIRASALGGAIMADADDDVLGAVDRFALDLGLAFQIVDDILDVEGAAADLGKSVGKDAAQSKPTYPSQFGLEGARGLASECIARARQALVEARLTDGWLGAIAEWVLSRRH